MKKLRRRLFMHFSFQFIAIAFLMLIVVVTTLIIVIGIWTRDYSEYHSYQAKLEEIMLNTGDSFKTINMAEGWDESFEDDNIWVQIVNESGVVIEEGNVPDYIPTRYSELELLEMKEKSEYKGYALIFFLETFYEEDFLFILGYESDGLRFLHEIVDTYKQDGVIAESEIIELEEKLNHKDATLHIYDENHHLKQSLGVPKIEKDVPLDVFGRDVYPDIYETKQHTYLDPESGNIWMLYVPNENKQEVSLELYQETMIGLIITTAIVLIITIVISIWNGFRYGNPLFIFANWLSRMGNEQYAEVLTERERKQVYRKNGKLKWRYRLYREVFENFYDMAEKLDASQKEREQLEKTREEWMAGISHDLRTPLTTMAGYGRLLESGEYDWTKEELVNIGKTIHEKSDYMVRLIEDFNLNFQLKNQGRDISFQRVELNSFLQKILKKFTDDITLQDYIFEFESSGAEVYYEINCRLFERMVDNLIYNAIKHNPEKTTITVQLKIDNGLQIVVADDGIGIDEETKKYLFSRYYRGTNTDERIEGTGLGMTIALQIARLHYGHIEVDSEKNKGTKVMISFQNNVRE